MDKRKEKPPFSKSIGKKADLFLPYDKLIGKGFLEQVIIADENIIRIYPPFSLKFEPSLNFAIFNNLPQRVERGGILGCKPIFGLKERMLIVNQFIFVKNIARNRYNSYIPDEREWNKAMTRIILKEHLIPIEFHCHPISKIKPGSKALEYLNQMGTSPADQRLSIPIVEFGNYRIAVPQAVFIKNLQTNDGFFIGVYGGLIAPNNFEKYLILAGSEKIFEICKSIFNWVKSDPRRKQVALKIMAATGVISILFLPQAIRLLGMLMVTGDKSMKIISTISSYKGEIMKYFGIANTINSTIIKFPKFDFSNISLNDLKLFELMKKSRKLRKVL